MGTPGLRAGTETDNIELKGALEALGALDEGDEQVVTLKVTGARLQRNG